MDGEDDGGEDDGQIAIAAADPVQIAIAAPADGVNVQNVQNAAAWYSESSDSNDAEDVHEDGVVVIAGAEPDEIKVHGDKYRDGEHKEEQYEAQGAAVVAAPAARMEQVAGPRLFQRAQQEEDSKDESVGSDNSDVFYPHAYAANKVTEMHGFNDVVDEKRNDADTQN